MGELKPNESQIGSYTVRRELAGFRIVAENGMGLATVETYAQAGAFVRDAQFMHLHLKMMGGDASELADAMHSGQIRLPSNRNPHNR